MELRIINKDERKRLGYDGHFAWPEQLHHINGRTFKKNFDFIKYQEHQIYWELNKYIGPAPERSFALFSYIAKHDHIIAELSLQDLIGYFHENRLIDGQYLPAIGDEIKLWKGYRYKKIKGIDRADFPNNMVSYIYHETGWQEGNYNWEFDETLFIMNGIAQTRL